MITQFEVPGYIEERLPELKPELQKRAGTAANTIGTALQCLADFTRRMVREHNTTMAGRCLSVAANLYSKGNETVKGTVENIYVFSFSSLLNSCDNYRDRAKLQAVLPGSLYRAYVKQVTHSGI